MLKSNIDVFFVTSFLCSLKFLLFHRIEYPKRCLIIFFLWLSFCDMTVPSKAMYRPCDLVLIYCCFQTENITFDTIFCMKTVIN